VARTLYERKCLSCGLPFVASRPNIEYCDLDCCYMASIPQVDEYEFDHTHGKGRNK
jgi:hypothetical protein